MDFVHNFKKWFSFGVIFVICWIHEREGQVDGLQED